MNYAPTGGSLVVTGATIVTMNANRDIVQADVVVDEDGAIAALLPPGAPLPSGARKVNAAGRVIVPGLVQAHLHLCQTLFRGLSEERTLLAWLRERIWPLEAAHDPASLRASARLGIVELLLSGTTAILDMGTVYHTDQLFLAAEESGLRYVGGQALMDRGVGVPAGLMQTTEEALRESDALRARWDGAANGRLSYGYAPRFVLSCSGRLLREVAERARSGARVHTHASEHKEELDAVRAELGCGDVEFFGKLGLTGPNLVLAHGVWLDESDLLELTRSGSHVAHCPASNLKLGSGLAPVQELRRRGVNVALGADGAACSNRLDVWSQLWLAGLAASLRGGPGALHASEVFELATLGGARALGLEHEIGSVEPGKRADLVVLHLSRHEPNGDVYTTLVYSARPDDVQTVLIDGRVVVEGGRLVRLDERAVRTDAIVARDAVLARLGESSAYTKVT